MLPGGFAYGDYLRAGALAALSPMMGAVKRHAEAGGLVLGICNGFQVLLEAGLLPGAMRRNAEPPLPCRDVYLQGRAAPTCRSPAATAGQVLRLPIAHAEGNYEDAARDASTRLEAAGQVVFRYCDAGRPGRPPSATPTARRATSRASSTRAATSSA